MSAPAATQFNVRINEAIKHEGDRVFASIGLTPTKAVRALYEWAIRNKNHPEAVGNVLDADRSDSPSEERRALLEIARSGRRIIPDTMAEAGIEEQRSIFSDDSNERAQQYKKIAKQAAWEKFA